MSINYDVISLTERFDLFDIQDTISGEAWPEWTRLAFPGSGECTVPKALCPIAINPKEDMGLYIEPNVWVLHDLARTSDGQ